MWTMCTVQHTVLVLTYVHDATLLLYRIKFIKYYICVSLGFSIRASLIYSFNFICGPRCQCLLCWYVLMWINGDGGWNEQGMERAAEDGNMREKSWKKTQTNQMWKPMVVQSKAGQNASGMKHWLYDLFERDRKAAARGWSHGIEMKNHMLACCYEPMLTCARIERETEPNAIHMNWAGVCAREPKQQEENSNCNVKKPRHRKRTAAREHESQNEKIHEKKEMPLCLHTSHLTADNLQLLYFLCRFCSHKM